MIFVPLTIKSYTTVIPLTKRKYALVDSADWPALSRWQWSAENSRGVWYAKRFNAATGEKIKMHLSVMPPRGPLRPDHINRNGLDNRRMNLRLATHSQNCANRRCKPSSSGYRGVAQVGECTWHASIKFQQKRISLGRHSSPAVAAAAYDAKAKELFGEFAQLNFA